MNIEAIKQSHASRNRTHRAIKAEKIIRLLETLRPLAGLRILEVGTGSGVIAACLAARAGADGAVTATDIADQRITRDGYHFVQVTDTHLPFPEASFAIVVAGWFRRTIITACRPQSLPT